MTREELAADFAKRIPLSTAMGIELAEWGTDRAVIRAPFAANKNHVETIFGGSLYAVAALTCYALFRAITLEFALNNDQLVIKTGTIDYRAPVRGDFVVTSLRPADGAVEKFAETYRRHGKARLNLVAEVRSSDGALGAVFQGDYVLS